MKKLIFIAITTLLFASCTTVKTITESRELVFIDYGKYTDKGFLFSPYIYNGEFESVGPVEYTYSPGAQLKEATEPDINNYPIKTKRWVYDNFDIYKAIDDVYNECVKMKADALIETKITTVTQSFPYAPPAIIPVVKITGFAIRRK